MIRSAVIWGISHGLPRRILLRNARHGDLLAQLAMHPDRRADPYAGYEELRRRGVFVRGTRLWGTVDHTAATGLLRSEDVSVDVGAGDLQWPIPQLLGWARDLRRTGPVDPPSMLAVDPPAHTRYRRLVSRAFTVRKVEALEATVREVADKLVAELASGSHRADLIEQYAARLPVAVIAEILGVPEEMRDQVLAWGNDAAVTLDPGLSWRQYVTAERAIRELHDWFDRHIESLRTNPGDDLLSQLATLEGPDAPDRLELHAVGLLVLGAGFETTVNLIGNGIAQLDAHPEQREEVLGDASLWGNTVEEVLRYDSPVQLTFRLVTRDTTVAGQHLKPGTPVLSFLGGANRDPAVFTDPARFDVRRENAGEHLSFSSGVHYCLGASLARLEARVALETLFDRFPDLRVAGQPLRRTTRVLRGYEHLPVRLR